MRKSVLIAGNAYPGLGRDIATALELEEIPISISSFADGETHIRLAGDVREKQVLIVQPTSPPSNEHLMTLALLADTVRGAGAAHVVAVVPYFGYARQDVRSDGPLSAALAARILQTAGVDHIVVLELHSPALESAFPTLLLHLRADELMLPAIRDWRLSRLTVVAPDAGGLKRAQRYAMALDVPLAAITKTRIADDMTATLHVLGEVRGRSCLIVDDIVSTGGTIAHAANALFAAGAAEVHALFVHAVMAPGALEKIRAAGVARLLATDSVHDNVSHPYVDVIPIAPFLAKALMPFVRERSTTSEIGL